MGEDVLVPGGRDVRGTLDGEGEACVVACPPHPQHGGAREDPRLRAVSGALGEHGLACLRFDYGPWDGGRGERRDVENAVGWAADRFRSVGLFGYSFGATLALLVAADEGVVAAASALAPGRDAAAAFDRLDRPAQVIYGARDTTVDSSPVAERARERGAEVVELEADHFFVGKYDRIGGLVAGFVVERLGEPGT